MTVIRMMGSMMVYEYGFLFGLHLFGSMRVLFYRGVDAWHRVGAGLIWQGVLIPVVLLRAMCVKNASKRVVKCLGK